MDFKIIYEDNDLLVVDKPAAIVVFPEGPAFAEAAAGKQTTEKTVIDYLTEKYPQLAQVGLPPRYGVAHRLDKDTSGILLVAKNSEALIFFQNQFKKRTVTKKYIALVVGTIKEDFSKIETLIARSPADPRKQKAYPIENSKFQNPNSKTKKLRESITEYKVLQRFYAKDGNDYTLLEVMPKTGRKHQIRCHMAYIHHPIAGDKLYAFKDSPSLNRLSRHFLHAAYLKIQLPSGEIKDFRSELPEELNSIIKNLKL